MLIILDRDGVINEDSEDYIKSPEEWHPIPGSLAAIAALNRACHTVVVATNQSGLGRGYYSKETLEKIHEKMHHRLAAVSGHLDGIYYCPHAPEAQCDCRKPKPGLLYQIKRDFPALFDTAIFVGDQLRDLQAARAAHCTAVWIRSNKNAQAELPEGYRDVPIYPSLLAFVEALLK